MYWNLINGLSLFLNQFEKHKTDRKKTVIILTVYFQPNRVITALLKHVNGFHYYQTCISDPQKIVFLLVR
jgi:hypothetical protein